MAIEVKSSVDWEAEGDVDTLTRAKEIEADAPRLRRALKRAKIMAKVEEKKLNAIKKVADKKVPVVNKPSRTARKGYPNKRKK